MLVTILLYLHEDLHLYKTFTEFSSTYRAAFLQKYKYDINLLDEEAQENLKNDANLKFASFLFIPPYYVRSAPPESSFLYSLTL